MPRDRSSVQMSRNPRACARALVATLMLSLLPSNRWQQRRLVRHVRYGRASPWLIGDTIALPALRNRIACLGYTAGFVRMFYNDAIPESFDAVSDGPLLSARKLSPRNSEWRKLTLVGDRRILGFSFSKQVGSEQNRSIVVERRRSIFRRIVSLVL